MDASLVAFLFVGGTLLFAILALAKDREGKGYGVKRMALLWLATLPYFLSSAFEFTVKDADGSIESVKITHSLWFLLIMPGAMIADNIAHRKKTKQSQEKDILLRHRTVMLEGEITDSSANDIIARILYLQSQSRAEPIHLIITSPGGSVSAGLAIIDIIDEVGPPVHTHCVKEAHSMAAVTLSYGRAGSRSISGDAVISFSIPKTADPSKETEAERFGSILVSKVSKATNLPIDRIRTLFIEAKNLSAKQAVDLEIVDRIEGATNTSK